jgi:hypothetical protein
MGDCTIWPPALKRWFDNRFGDLCTYHDEEYIMRKWHEKCRSDVWVAAHMMLRSLRFMLDGYAGAFFSILAVPFLWTFGTAYWAWKKYKVKI